MKSPVRLTALALAILALASSCRSQETQPAVVVQSPRKGHLDVTFLLASDMHFGAKTVLTTTQLDSLAVPIEQANAHMIDHMNAIAGRPYPADIGGKVGSPRALLAAGDLTDDGTAKEWANFEKFYGLTGKEGRLKMPVYETAGNHDIWGGDTVSKAVTARHGGECYSLDWDDLHVICLGPPRDECLPWIAKDLAAVGRDRPVVIYFHYSILGPYSEDYWFGAGSNRKKLAEAIAGFNVIGLFHGHFHASGLYQWQGHDIYNVGSPKHSMKDFFVVHVTDDRLTVCSWNYEGQPGWWWCHSKPINDPAKRGPAAIVRIYPHPGVPFRPLIPHPLVDTARMLK